MDYNCYLIEVNTNPCLEESSNILKVLLPRMLDDLFKLTIDQVYLPAKDVGNELKPMVNQISHSTTKPREEKLSAGCSSSSAGKSIYPVSGYRDSVNMW